MRSLMFLALLMLLCGACSRSNKTEVTGQVLLDEKPVTYGVISFWPIDGVGPSAQGLIQDGKYRLEVPPGEKKVGVEAVEKAGEHALPGSENVKVAIHEPVSPESYRSPDLTTLRCTISTDTKVHDFRLSSR
jgi:hypothetical protein